MSVWVVVGIVFLLVGAGLLWWRSRTMRAIGLMAQVETSSTRNAAAKPPGTLVEVKGTVRCEAPLRSEYAQVACVHYNALQTERYVVHEQDSQGRLQRRERTRTLYTNTRSVPFVVEDASGSILVLPDGAEIEAATVFEQTEGRGGFSVSAAIGDMVVGGGTPLDQTWRESAVQLDVPVYVLGVVQPDRSLGAPERGRKDAAFVISVKSEEERAADKGREARWLTIFAIMAIVLGAACLIVPRLIGMR